MKRKRTVYLPEDLDRQLRLSAARADLIVSDLITAAVRAYLEENKLPSREESAVSPQ